MDHIAYEKLLYLYSRALDEADFETIERIMRQAAHDPTLKTMLFDLETAYHTEPQEMGEIMLIGAEHRNGRHLTLAQPIVRLQRRATWSLRAAVVALVLVGLVAIYLVKNSEKSNHVHTTLISSGRELATAVSTPVPVLMQGRTAITAENADQITLLVQLGRGSALDAAWSPDGRILAVSSPLGIWLYDTTNAQAEPHLLDTTSIEWYWPDEITWSPDGRYLTSNETNDVMTHIWDAETGELVLEVNGNTAAWSPDGTRLASRGEDQKVYIWDMVSGISLVVLEVPFHPWSLTWSPGGTWLATTEYGNNIRIWDVVTGEQLEWSSRLVGSAVAWSPDGTRLATGGSPRLSVWDVNTQERMIEIDTGESWTREIEWSPDSQYLATNGEGVRIWDATTGELVKEPTFAATFPMRSMSWSPDGTRLVSIGDDQTVYIWDAETGESLLEFAGYLGYVDSIAWSPDGTRLALAEGKNVRIWDIKETSSTVLVKNSDTVSGIAWSPDGTRIASGSWDNLVRVWDAATGENLVEMAGHTNEVSHVTWSPDSTHLASGSIDTTVRIWDATSGKIQAVLEHTDGVTSVAWSPDGTRLISADGNGDLYFWDTTTGARLATLEGHPIRVGDMAWSPDGMRLASASTFDQSVRIWDAVTGENLIVLGYTGTVIPQNSGWLFPDGLPNDPVIQAYARVNCVAWSPDNTLLALGTANHTLLIWDAKEEEHLTMQEWQSTSGSKDLAWSPDGTMIAIGNFDGTVQLWGIPVSE